MSKNRKYYHIIYLCLFLLCFSSTAFADMGLPTIVVIYPAMVVALIPIIVIEGFVLLHCLKIRPWLAFKCSFISNSISTLIGIPITWVLLVGLDLILGGGIGYGIDSWFKKIYAVTIQAPWLIPYEDDFKWMIPIAITIMLILFFFASWYVEYVISVRVFTKNKLLLNKAEVKHSVLIGNLYSYAFLEGVFLFCFYFRALLK